MGSGLSRDHHTMGTHRCHKAGSNHWPSEPRAQDGKNVGRGPPGGVEPGLHHRSFRASVSVCKGEGSSQKAVVSSELREGVLLKASGLALPLQSLCQLEERRRDPEGPLAGPGVCARM